VIISALTRDQGHADCPLRLNWLAVKGTALGRHWQEAKRGQIGAS